MNSTYLLLFPAWDEITRINLPLWGEKRERRHTEERENHESFWKWNQSHVAPKSYFRIASKKGVAFFFKIFFSFFFFLYFIFALSQSSARCSDWIISTLSPLQLRQKNFRRSFSVCLFVCFVKALREEKKNKIKNKKIQTKIV